jgi:Tol biopolymer transport system component
VFSKSDAGSETLRPLFIEHFPDCGGPISPDGKYVLIKSSRDEGNLLSVRDLETGAVQPVGRNMTGATWSPDGRWIAAIEGVSGSENVVLIDATDTSRRRNLGRTYDTQARWSPDSKYLLIIKPQWGCGAYLWSLETINVQTGKRNEIKSAHCKIIVNSTGWMDLGTVR